MASSSQITLELKNGRISVESNLTALFLADSGGMISIIQDEMEIQIRRSIEETRDERHELKIIEFVNKLSNLENLYFMREFQPSPYAFHFPYLKSLTLSNVGNLSKLSSLPTLHTLHIEYFNLNDSANLYKFQQIETLILGPSDVERRIKKETTYNSILRNKTCIRNSKP